MANTSFAQTSNRLVAILLVTRSRPGPRIAFHYPPDPQIPLSNASSSEHEDSIASDESDEEEQITTNRPRHGSSDATVRDHGGEPNRRNISNKTEESQILGYSHDALERLLSPGRWCERKKFEVCLDGLAFLGFPIFALEDGKWVRKNTTETNKPSKPALNQTYEDVYETGYDYYDIEAFRENVASITLTKPDGSPEDPIHARPVEAQSDQHDFSRDPDSFDSKAAAADASLGTSFNSGSTASAILGEQMNMFHVVFVFSGAYGKFLTDAHESVVKPLSSALYQCQKRKHYVARETHKIQAALLKAKADGVPPAAAWAHVVEKSELAWALREVFNRISKDEVAAIRLNGTPLGLHLPSPDQIDASDIQPHHAVLLLEEKDALIRQLSISASSDASPLALFIREHTATKSLSKLAVRTGLAFPDLQYLVRHLIKWRKARLISPLQPRNIYIISPSAPTSSLAEKGLEYGNRFPALPSLTRMLKALGGKPLPFWAFIPSKDHRLVFMEILEWMIRRGFVAQWRSVGWLKIPENSSFYGRANINRQSYGLVPPHERLMAEDDASSVASERTTVPVVPSPRPGISNSQVDNRYNPQVSQHGEVRIMRDPADPLLDLRALQDTIADLELREHFPALMQHFNGRSILEEIATKGQWKRAKVDAWLETLERRGLLLRARML